MRTLHLDRHFGHRANWLRAAVLGANDGLISISCLVVGLGSAALTTGAQMLAAVAGIVGGAMSMAAGEYVSVHSQRDVEEADLAIERGELRDDPAGELAELAEIYVRRGLPRGLALDVAQHLSKRDALDAHARDELGINLRTRARPIQAALASAASFVSGGVVPALLLAILPPAWAHWGIGAATVGALAVLGAIGAALGGSQKARASIRVAFFGTIALVVTSLAGKIAGSF